MDWFSVLFGGGVVGIISAFGYLVRHWFKGKGGYLIAKASADNEIAKTQAAIDDKRDTVAIKEMRAILKIKEIEHKEDRDEIHRVRNQNSVLHNELSICRIDGARKDEKIKSQEEKIKELQEKIKELQDELDRDDVDTSGPRSSKIHKSLPPTPTEGEELC